jgi:propionate CoA-transferase
MRRNKVISADEAVRVMLDGDTVATSGFVGIGFPESLALALERRFLAKGTPRDITLVYAAGQGDGMTRGLNHLGHEGMVRRVIGGHWALVPALGALALENKIEAYCFPQGVLSHLYRDIAAHRPGTLTKIGLRTFVDPRIEGGRMNDRTTEDLVQVVQLLGEEYLFFPAFPVDVGLLRGTTADEEGNVTMEREALTLDGLAIAQAVKNSGGIVIVQVERVTAHRTLSPQLVNIPGMLVDAVVIAPPGDHSQTFLESYNPAYTGETVARTSPAEPAAFNLRKVIARRAAMVLRPNAVVNLGIGMPEGVAAVAREERILDLVTLTVEAGGIGGVPASGLSFGAVTNAQAIIDQPYMFDFYDGGGLDQAFLGMAEVDEEGNVNVSKFHPKLAGPGGFINITQTAKRVIFMATFAPRTDSRIADGRLKVIQDGPAKRFVREVQQITFSGKYALERGQEVLYITERCVFRLTLSGLELTELAPGIDLEVDVLKHMEFTPRLADPVRQMDLRIFRPETMGLAQESPLSLDERLVLHSEENLMYVNFEGLRIESEEQCRELADFLDQRFRTLSHKVNVIVNYDNFELAPAVEESFFSMIRHNTEQFFLSATRYSTNAFFRHQMGNRFADASLDHSLYRSFDEARADLNP